jgi:hypothetical protein
LDSQDLKMRIYHITISCFGKLLFLSFFFLFISLAVPFTLFAQRQYKSKEEEKYNKLKNADDKKLMPIDSVRSFNKDYLRVYSSEQYFINDINYSNLEKLEMDMNFLNPSNLVDTNNAIDAVQEICRYSNESGRTAILFLDSKYDEFVWGEPGYWIRFEGEIDTVDYYMGIARNYYFNIFNSGRSIWKNDSTLQFSALRVRLVESAIHPVQPPTYEIIDKNLIIEVTLAELMKDSDKDGLTDIVEDKLMLNPYSNDSDDDGVNDLVDSNPRFKSYITNETLLYKGIIDSYVVENLKIRKEKILNPKRPKLIDILEKYTYLIVTDDKNLQSVGFDYNKYIIMTNDEYKIYKHKYPVSLIEIEVTPFFKVDNESYKYFISEYTDLGGTTFLVTKLKNGYNLLRYGMWIY